MSKLKLLYKKEAKFWDENYKKVLLFKRFLPNQKETKIYHLDHAAIRKTYQKISHSLSES